MDLQLFFGRVRIIGNCLTNVDDDDISSSRMSYPELEIAEPTGDMVICWKDV